MYKCHYTVEECQYHTHKVTADITTPLEGVSAHDTGQHAMELAGFNLHRAMAQRVAACLHRLAFKE